LSAPAISAIEEPVQVTIEGLTDMERSNVAAALALPPGLVEEGRVDEQWLERFEQQIPGKVRSAMEPFGYYRPEISVNVGKPDGGVYRLRVTVNKGEPVRLIDVQVRAEGPGAGEKNLTEEIEKFPLHKGDVLRQDIYERAKEGLKNRLVDLGYLDADFSTHRINLSLANLEAEIELVVDTGPLYRLETFFSPETLRIRRHS
jgi:translocation and assembly module TamA